MQEVSEGAAADAPSENAAEPPVAEAEPETNVASDEAPIPGVSWTVNFREYFYM